MGGGLSSLSKAVIVEPSTRPGVDVDYTFAQVSVDKPIVDYAANCGNLASAVGPYAVDQGLVIRPDGPATVRLFNTNTNKASTPTSRSRGAARESMATSAFQESVAPAHL